MISPQPPYWPLGAVVVTHAIRLLMWDGLGLAPEAQEVVVGGDWLLALSLG